MCVFSFHTILSKSENDEANSFKVFYKVIDSFQVSTSSSCIKRCFLGDTQNTLEGHLEIKHR